MNSFGRLPLVLFLAAFVARPTGASAQLPAPAPYNGLILQQIQTMPQAGGYSAAHLATQRLGDSVSLGNPAGLNVLAAQAQPSYCSGATYLVFLKTLDALSRRGSLPADDRALAEMQRWMQLDHAAYFEEIRHPLFDVRARLPFDSLPTASVPDADATLALLTERLSLAGLEILYVDFTPPGSTAVALKAIVPGLEVETMTYQRIGARNLRRLLARGSRIVGVG